MATPEELTKLAATVEAMVKTVAADKQAISEAAKAVKEDKVVAKNAATRAEAAIKWWPLLATVILTLAPIAVAFYFGTQRRANASPDESRVLISTLVCFLGMAFACLGFGLFLVGATGAFKGSGASGSSRSINVETAAPGLVVIVCATIVIYLAIDLIRPPAAPTPAAPTTKAPPADAGVDAGPTVDAGTPP